MKNPYEVLGVSPTCTNEELKEAYRALVKKYHPDQYSDSKLADLASEKMKEINAAYDEILRIRTGSKGNDHFDNSGAEGTYSAERAPIYNRIREAINAGNFRVAEDLLKSIKEEEKCAEWYFLRACVYLHGNFYFNAMQMLDKACQMDPTNQEYASMREQLRAKLNNFHSNGTRYSQPQGQSQPSDSNCNCSICDCCAAIWCLDCLCGACR